MKHFFTILPFCFIITLPLFAQVTISGRVTDTRQNPLAGANVYLKGTFDGATSAGDGTFSFTTTKTGAQTLLVSLMNYQTDSQRIALNGQPVQIKITLHERINKLNAVTISAGSFSISDQSKNPVLRPLDIVSIAGAGADPMDALRTLPGAQRVPNQTGLFIQGGTGEETLAFIDGMQVLHPFYSATPDIGSRARFNPFLFSGTLFSSGGYSAQYGGALSAAVILDSRGLPDRSSGTLGISSVGVSGGFDHLSKNKKSAYGASLNYANLWPYFKLVRQKQDYTLPPFDLNGDVNFRIKTSSTGMLKFYGYLDYNKIQFGSKDLDHANSQDLFRLKNKNAYTNLTYKESLGKKKNWRLYLGAAYNTNTDQIKTGYAVEAEDPLLDSIKEFTQLAETKAMLTRSIGTLSEIRAGVSYQYQTDHVTYRPAALDGQADSPEPSQRYLATLHDNYTAAFLETDLYFTPKFVARLGGRAEYSSWLDKYNLAPRVSLAYRLAKDTKISAAWGDFYQKPKNRYMLSKQDLGFMKAQHYILTFQHLTQAYTWRVNLFYKDYDHLLKTVPDTLTTGDGYAQGIEFFWRDRKTIKNADYWIAYTYLDTKRDFLNYPQAVQPPFASKHTLNVVYKQFIPAIMTNLSATYTFASGKPYFNPNRTENEFMADKTPALNTLALSAAYLIKGKKIFTVLVFSVDNVLGSKQIYGYRFSHDGSSREAITSPAKRFFFLGAFFSFGIDRSQDVINNNL